MARGSFWSVRCFVVLVGVLLLVGPARAADAAPEDRTLSPYFFVKGGDPSVDRLPLRSTKVDVAVSGVIASVTVSQVYENAGTRPISAEYVFPASTRAAVHGLRMAIGSQVVVAKIAEREQARKEYEAHERAGKNAALLEQQRPNVFTMRVANVMPGDHVEVTLRYTELLVPEGGTYELVYPTVVGPRYSNVPAAGAPGTSGFVASPYLPPGREPVATFELAGTLSSAIPVQSLESPSHTLRAAWDNPGLVRFSVDGTKGGDRDVVLRYGLAGKAIQSGLLLHAGAEERSFLLVVQPPKRVTPAELPPREYVFVLDVSGSMGGFPLETAKRMIRELCAGLRPADSFNVLLFAGASHLLWPASEHATRDKVDEALDVIDRERGGGGTELLPALERALTLPAQGGARSVIVVTDGYIESDRRAITLVREHLGDANLFAFGIGSSVNRYLVEGLAHAGEGEPFVVTDAAEAPAVAARFRDYVASPVLSHVKVSFDGLDVYDVEPRTVPDVLADRPVIVHGKYRGEPRGTITVSGVAGSGPHTQRFDVSTVSPRPENRALPYLWARARIAAVSDFGFGEVTDAQRAQVTALGLRYELLTAFTSFIAVSEVVRTSTPAEGVQQPQPLPAGVSADAVGPEPTEAPEPELVLLLLCAAAGALVLAASRGGLRVRGAS